MYQQMQHFLQNIKYNQVILKVPVLGWLFFYGILNKPELICMHIVEWFQVLLSNYNLVKWSNRDPKQVKSENDFNSKIIGNDFRRMMQYIVKMENSTRNIVYFLTGQKNEIWNFFFFSNQKEKS